jgi:hypothetical protein
MDILDLINTDEKKINCYPRHSRFTQKRIEATQKELASLLKAFDAELRVAQDVIKDLHKDIEIEKRSKEELLDWIKKADEIGDHHHASTMTKAWLLVEQEQVRKNLNRGSN